MNKICLSILIGIPGAGKTTFCNNFRGYIQEQKSSIELIHFCFDRFIQIEDQIDLEQGLFKRKRQSLLQCIDCVIEALQKNDPFLIKQTNETLEKEYGLDVPLQLEPSSEETLYVLLLDDNMYYRSMRYDIFKLARKYCIGYQQIYLEVPLKDALVRNARRTKPVPENIVSRMWMKLEKPSPKFYSWETNSMTIRTSPADFGTITSEIVKLFNEPESHVNSNITEPPEMEQSDIHKLDLLLRKAVGEILSNNKPILSGAELKLLSKELMVRKQAILNDLETGLVQISPDNITNEEIHLLF